MEDFNILLHFGFNILSLLAVIVCREIYSLLIIVIILGTICSDTTAVSKIR